MNHKRMRSITFRISREEYVSAVRLSALHGSRSLSDYVRMALAHLVARDTQMQNADASASVMAINRLVEEVEMQLKHLARLLKPETTDEATEAPSGTSVAGAGGQAGETT